MGKKAQTGKAKPKIDDNGVLIVPPPRTIANQDHFHRLNYLYQLSAYQTKPRAGAVKGHTPLARNYIKSMDLISKKTKTSLLPTLKRTICKRCHRLLWAPKRLEITRDGALAVVCGCGAVKRYNVAADADYKTYSEREGNLLNP
ncbi:ribonuclease P protein subunit RPR2 [Saccharomyces eubayanus]|uniref:ribonuclease P protein subunit RPR2 n=1 Tax=Saccharomyces eubayanus TaxID=1080349 RepID=UPI0006C1D411|nr:RPR2-like protein [Saccharomyces eubayanus]KOG98903.1 RPR2-like protein [Saccharomyces eubayanus]